MNEEYVVYIIINSDLKMKKGKMIAQGCHVFYNLSQGVWLNQDQTDRLLNWESSDERKIITLKANQEEIKELIKDFRFFCTVDAGFTQVPKGSITALAVLMTKEEKENHTILKELKLL
jgi:peptidyl-tRNA hydrolase